MRAAAALPIARFSSAAMKRRAPVGQVRADPRRDHAPPDAVQQPAVAQVAVRSLRMVCGVTSKRAARSSTLTRPARPRQRENLVLPMAETTACHSP